jgi:hypothetical protein
LITPFERTSNKEHEYLKKSKNKCPTFPPHSPHIPPGGQVGNGGECSQIFYGVLNLMKKKKNNNNNNIVGR